MGDVAVLPPIYKNRRNWLIAFGIAEILIGCLVLMGIALSAYAIRRLPAAPGAAPPDMRSMAVIGVFYAFIALVFVAVGIGSIQTRRWARIAALILSWGWLGIGVLSTAVIALLLPAIMKNAQAQAKAPAPAGATAAVSAVMIGFVGLFFILLPLVFVLFYSNKNVKATCENAREGSAGPMKPVPVWIATAWFAMGVLGYLFVLVRPALPLFGIVFVGWQAVAVALALEALTVWLTLNLYRQRAVAWKVAVGWTLVGWVSIGVTIARYGFAGMYIAMGYTEREIAGMLPMVKYLLGGCSGIALLFVVFLIATRKHYTDAADFPALP